MDTDFLKVPNHFDFPFTPYDIQHQFMKQLYFVIENKKLGIFESPTGTGKSLSIICGAIRWLKDHNNFVRENISKQISLLELEKDIIASSSTDWLSTQAKELELTHKINALRLEQNKISDYDKKIDNLKNLKKEKSKLKNWKNVKKDPSDGELLQKEETVGEEDVLLEEILKENETEDEEEDETNKFQPVKIFICSRTHSQLSQFVGEIIKSPFGDNVRVVSLASRQNYCINPSVSKLKNMALINERCLDLQKNKSKQLKSDEGKIIKKQKGVTSCKCPYYRNEAIEDLRDWSLIQIQDIEELINSGKELNACPYYASRKAVEDAEIVLIPYNTLLHKATREANGIQLKNNVVIIDEAHNLLEALAQMHSSDLHYKQIENSLHQLKCYKQKFHKRFSAVNLLSINQLIFVVTKLKQIFDNIDKEKSNNFTNICTIESFVLTAQIDNYNMFKLTEFCKNSRLAQKIRNYAIKFPVEEQLTNFQIPQKGIKGFLSSIENKNIKQESSSEESQKTAIPSGNPILSVISFLETLTYSYEDGRILMVSNQNESYLKFLLLNPSSNFIDIVKEARSVIVAGGTMKPNAEFRDRLFMNAGATSERIVEFSCDHIIPAENILPIVMAKGANQESLLFNYENRMNMGNNIKNIILRCCKSIKGGIVVFFPSYKYENWIWNQLKDLNFGRMVFREPQNSGSVDSVLEKYAEAIKRPFSKGALLFSVVGGKLSEGLNFSDDLGRCVIVVGMPYANINAVDLKEKMTYLDKNEGKGAGQKFYEGLCMKAVNQCIGRAVRHKDDYATVLLLDERYNRVSTKNALPGWIRRSLKVCNYEETFLNIDKFFVNKKKIL